MGNINFLTADVNFKFSRQKKIRDLILLILKKEISSVPEFINIIFCSDQYLLEINKRYLHHNFYTDIITFNYSGNDKSLEGELYISIDRIKENAKSLGVPQQDELFRVIIHGILHLCGYNDKRKQEKGLMRELEDRYLQSL